jgi:hypothetical protein
MASVHIKTANWDLEVWGRDDAIERGRRSLRETLVRRGREASSQRIRVVAPGPILVESSDFEAHLPPMFFENQIYHFEFTRLPDEPVTVRHRRRNIEEAFRRRKDRLTASIQFGNDVGWFHLDLCFVSARGPRVDSIMIEVSPTKLDMESDLQLIHARIDESYPLWRFSFARSTEQNVRRVTRPHDRLPLLWIEHFRQLRRELDASVRLVCNAPHQRSIASSRSVRLDALRGRLSPRREERVGELLQEDGAGRRISQSIRTLTVDTPENRFVREVLEQCGREINRFADRLKAAALRAPDQDISTSVRRELDTWRTAVRERLDHGLFRALGPGRTLLEESLVLHHRVGYAGVYRVWQRLRMYFELLGNDAEISMKTVSELYEVWCFLELRSMLSKLGFEEELHERPSLNTRGVEVSMDAQGMGAAFRFRKGSTRVRLAHEPVYRRYTSGLHDGETLSWLLKQRPDFVLEATFDQRERLLWVFDAKYRIQRGEAGDGVIEDGDRAPDDAINQMHRYRDAIVRCERAEDHPPRLSRPVVGAFVLFPGWFSEQAQSDPADNPYREAIDAVGIGAFPLLPGQNNPWLEAFLRSQLDPDGANPRTPDIQLAQPAARIVTAGLRVRRDADLVFIAHLAAERGSTQRYIDGFRQGNARWFHAHDAVLARGALTRERMADITRCAISVSDPELGTSSIHFVYDVREVRRTTLDRLSSEQLGLAGAATEHDPVWLFELGASVRLAVPLEFPRPYEPSRTQAARVASFERLREARAWHELDDRY